MISTVERKIVECDKLFRMSIGAKKDVPLRGLSQMVMLMSDGANGENIQWSRRVAAECFFFGNYLCTHDTGTTTTVVSGHVCVSTCVNGTDGGPTHTLQTIPLSTSA